MVSRIVISIFSSSLKRSQNFYTKLLSLNTIFEAKWIIQLSSAQNESLNLTLQPRDHQLVPKRFQTAPQGTCITFVVPDCDAIYKEAVSMNLEIIQEPKNEDYGQRRFLTVDPDGQLIDISSPCEPSQDFIDKYMSG